MNEYRKSILVLLTLPALALAEDKAGVQPIKVVAVTRKEPLSYEKDIEPIFVKKCLVCHSGSVKEGRFDVSTYAVLMQGGKRGKSLVPGKSAESKFIHWIGKTEKPFMPPKSEEPLTPEELALIKLWVDQGAKAPTAARVLPRPVLTALPANVQPVRALALSPDKTTVAAGRGNHLHLYDARSGAHLRSLLDPALAGPDNKPIPGAHLSLVESLAFSPDGKFLASGSYQEVLIWDARAGAIAQRLGGFADRVMALAFSRDGKWLAAGGGPASVDGELKVFHFPAAQLALDLKKSHTDTIFGLCFSPDNSKLASAAADKFVKVFEIPSGKCLKTFEGHTHHVLDVSWKADGKLLASAGADHAVKLWDYEKGEQVRTISGHTKQVSRLLFIGATAHIATGSGDATLKFFDGDSGRTLRTVDSGADFLHTIGISPDGALLAAGGEDGSIRLFNGANGQLLKTLLPPGAPPPPK